MPLSISVRADKIPNLVLKNTNKDQEYETAPKLHTFAMIFYYGSDIYFLQLVVLQCLNYQLSWSLKKMSSSRGLGFYYEESCCLGFFYVFLGGYAAGGGLGWK